MAAKSGSHRRLAPLLLALALTAGLRLPSFAWSAISDDEAIYDAAALAIGRGGVLYQDAIDHKPPGLAYTYAAAYACLPAHVGPKARTSAVHLVGLLAAVGTALGLYVVAGQLGLGACRTWPALLFATSSAAKVPFDGLAVNGELLMGLPTVWAVAAALAATFCAGFAGMLLDVAAGGLCALAVLYKWQAGLVGLALLPLLAVGRPASRWAMATHGEAPSSLSGPGGPPMNWQARSVDVACRLLCWATGLAIPLAATAAYFASRQALFDAWYWGLAFNRLYLGASPLGAWWWQRLGLSLLGTALPAALLYACGLQELAQVSWALLTTVGRLAGSWLPAGGLSVASRWASQHSLPAANRLVFAKGLALRKGEGNAGAPSAAAPRPSHVAGPLVAALAAWSLLSLAAVALGGRFFGHYYLQAELPLCLLAAPKVAAAWRRHKLAVTALLVLPAALFFALASVPTRAVRLLNPGNPDWLAVGDELRALAQPGDTLFVWGNAPLLSHHSDVPLATRFVFSNYLTGLSPATAAERHAVAATDHGEASAYAWRLLAEDFAKHPPSLIVDTAAAGWKGYRPYPMARYAPLARWLPDYEQVGLLARGAPVYRRRH